MTALLRYDAACRAIAEAKTIDEVSEWIDKAAAVREYGRRAKNRKLELDAIEIRVKAKRRRGELLLALKSAGQIKEGKRKLSSASDSLPVFTLKDLGVSADESSEEQKIAQIDGNSFERLIARCRAHTEAHPERHSFDVLKPPPEGPIKGARSIMGSRQEPDDSLDYFPTPPWATRALVERALPSIGIRKLDLMWEPACGEGHMAEVLAEYGRTSASDIHDYGYGDVADFLECKSTEPLADWIFTNPPFKKKTEEFLFQALKLARRGVALFVRMQWLETQGRYERIYSVNPPTLIAFFSERVPLCKGEWKPDGDTATAYIWLVWVKGMAPQPPFWFPPDCRDTLTKPDDAERFTQRPVVKLDRVYCDEPFDSETGEIRQSEAPAADNRELSPASPEPVSEPDSASQAPDAGSLLPTCAESSQVQIEHDAPLSVVEPAPAVVPSAVKGAGSPSSDDDQLEIPPFLRRNEDGSMQHPMVPA